MSLFTRVNTLLAAGSLWEILVSSDKELAERRPFNSLLVQNRSYSPVEVRVNNRLFGTVGGQAYATFSGLSELELDVLSIKNTGISSIPASKVTLYLTNGSTAVDISGLGTEIAGDIDIPITVTPTATALTTETDAHRFAKYFELSVSSMGALTPGTHKVYHGSGPYRELLNVGSYYNYEQSGKVYDLSTIKIKCDDICPGPELISNSSCTTAKPSLAGVGTDYLGSSTLDNGKVAFTTPANGASGSAYSMGVAASGYLNGIKPGATYEYKMSVLNPSASGINYWQISAGFRYMNNGSWTSVTAPLLANDVWQTLSSTVSVPATATAAYLDILCSAGVISKTFYFDDVSLKQTVMSSSDYPVVNLSGGY